MRALTEIPTMMFVAWVWGIAAFFWALTKVGILDRPEPNESATKFVVKHVGLGTLACLGLMLAVPGWLAGIPPEAGWLYYGLQAIAIFATLFVTGVAVHVVASMQSRLWLTASVALHVSLCLAILIVPVWQTHESAVTVYRELTIVDDIQPQCQLSATNLFAVLSDVHLVASSGPQTNDGNTPGNALIGPRLAFVQTLAPTYLFITGDLTDTGAIAEWELAWGALKGMAETTRIIVAPGNHDQNAAFVASRKLDADEAEKLEAVSVFDPKLAAYFKLQSRLVPGLSSAQSEHPLVDIVNRAPPAVAARDWIDAAKFFEEKVKICLTNSADDNAFTARIACQRGVRKFFPTEIRPITLVEEADDYWREQKRRSFPLSLVDSANSAAIIVLASDLSERESIGANAIGYFERPQLDGLRSVLRSIPQNTRSIVVVLHHPLTRPRTDTFELPAHRNMTLQALMDSSWWTYAFLRTNVASAKEVLAIIDDETSRLPQSHVYLLFGHRHKRSFGRLRRVTFVESPNIAAPERDRGVYVGSTSEGGLNISWCPQPSDRVATSGDMQR
jgi:hypothetical protein